MAGAVCSITSHTIHHNEIYVINRCLVGFFIYRDEHYSEDSPDKAMAELIIGKQCNCEIGTCKAAFVGNSWQVQPVLKI